MPLLCTRTICLTATSATLHIPVCALNHIALLACHTSSLLRDNHIPMSSYSVSSKRMYHKLFSKGTGLPVTDGPHDSVTCTVPSTACVCSMNRHRTSRLYLFSLACCSSLACLLHCHYALACYAATLPLPADIYVVLIALYTSMPYAICLHSLYACSCIYLTYFSSYPDSFVDPPRVAGPIPRVLRYRTATHGRRIAVRPGDALRGRYRHAPRVQFTRLCRTPWALRHRPARQMTTTRSAPRPTLPHAADDDRHFTGALTCLNTVRRGGERRTHKPCVLA